MVAQGALLPSQREVLRDALRCRRNLVICGGTGSGKTTLANALLRDAVDLAGPCERFVILEDTVELQCAAVVKFGSEAALNGVPDLRDAAPRRLPLGIPY